MKYASIFCKLLCLISIFSFLSIAENFAQTDWTKYPNNPVLGPGPEGSWEEVGPEPMSILLIGSIYHMWYGGYNSEWVMEIGYATSPDGINWTKHENNPVLSLGEDGNWDDASVYGGTVLFDGIRFHMWYSGTKKGQNGLSEIGYAYSDNGVDWHRYESNPVLKQGADGSWDSMDLSYPCVVFDGSQYHMLYNGWDVNYKCRIGYASSLDGITWSKYNDNPVIVLGDDTSWDANLVLIPAVIYRNNNFEMWYNGKSQQNVIRIGYATSTDGIIWSKYSDNPISLIPGNILDWDNGYVFQLKTLFDETKNVYKGWYIGGIDGSKVSVGCATAPLDPTIVVNYEKNFKRNEFVLNQNYPNPFNPTTKISFQLPNLSFVEISIFNSLGKLICSFVSKFYSAGFHSVEWSGRDDFGKDVVSGIYFYNIKARGSNRKGTDFSETKKMNLIR